MLTLIYTTRVKQADFLWLVFPVDLYLQTHTFVFVACTSFAFTSQYHLNTYFLSRNCPFVKHSFLKHCRRCFGRRGCGHCKLLFDMASMYMIWLVTHPICMWYMMKGCGLFGHDSYVNGITDKPLSSHIYMTYDEGLWRCDWWVMSSHKYMINDDVLWLVSQSLSRTTLKT